MVKYSGRSAPLKRKVPLENIETVVESILPLVCSKSEEKGNVM
jgi:hypothetical protein